MCYTLHHLVEQATPDVNADYHPHQTIATSSDLLRELACLSFQIEMTAVIFTIFGDSDFTARMGYAFFGTALVALPYFLRDHIGKHGALIAAVMLALSPALLSFSRFGRNPCPSTNSAGTRPGSIVLQVVCIPSFPQK